MIDRKPKSTKKLDQRKSGSLSGQTTSWWAADEGNCHTDVHATVAFLKRQWSTFYNELIQNVRRYEDKGYNIFSSNPYGKVIANKTLSLNVTASCIDTLVSKLTKNTPTVQYMANSSDYAVQRRAKELQKFIHGHFNYTNAYKTCADALADACKFGSGFIHLRERNGKVCYEIVKPYELMIDIDEAGFGEPMDMHIVKLMNRFQLILDHPEHKEALLKTSEFNPIYAGSKPYSNNMVLVTESYSKFAKRHVICVDNATLVDEDWNLEDKYGQFSFPLVSIKYKEADRNFFGIGLSEELKAIQNELSNLVQSAQRATRLLCVPKIFYNRASNIVKAHFDNDIGGLIGYDGNQIPQAMPLGAVPVDLYNQIENFYKKAYEIAGLSQLSSSSQLPTGMQQASGKALETFYQIESDRFQTTGKEYENLIIKLNDKTIDFMKMLSDEGKLESSEYYDKDTCKNISWDDVNIDRKDYAIQSFPVSLLPSTPEGKFQFVNDMMQVGLLDPVAAKKLMQMPDTDGYLDLQNAPVDFVMNHISEMLEGNEVEPDVNQDFDLSLDLVSKAYQLYSVKRAKPECLMLLENYINALNRISIAKQAEQQLLLQRAMMQQQQQQQGDVNAGSTGDTSGLSSGEPSGFATNAIG
jgi:hypothetical protein